MAVKKEKTIERPVVWEMTSELREAYERIQEIRSRFVPYEIDAKCEIGREVQTISMNPDKYGTQAVETLAQALGCSADSLYRCRFVVDVFGPEELASLKKLRNQGFRLTFTHIYILSLIGSAADRKKWTEVTMERRLTTRELRKQADEAIDIVEAKRPVRITPKSVRGGLKSMISVANKFLECCESQGDEDFFLSIWRTKSKEADAVLELVKEAEAQEEAVVAKATSNVNWLKASRKQLEEAIAEKAANDRSPKTPAFNQRKGKDEKQQNAVAV